MALGRDDRFVTDALGRALAGAQVYWCQPQPASTTNNPPSPLALIYTDSGGGTQLAQPVDTDGFGHAYAYLDGTQPFTVVIWHPLFGNNPLVLPDQFVAQATETTGLTPFSGIPTGTIDGTNRIFTMVNGSTPLTSIPPQATVWLNFALIEGLGYALSVVSGQVQITYAIAPKSTDNLWVQGLMTS